MIDFFYTLRAAKLPVSVKEYLTLLEALQAGVAPPIVLEATHEKTLQHVPLEVLHDALAAETSLRSDLQLFTRDGRVLPAEIDLVPVRNASGAMTEFPKEAGIAAEPGAAGALASGAMAAFWSHQTCASVVGRRTTCLSLGERPVCTPVSTSSAPPPPSAARPRASAARRERSSNLTPPSR